MAYTGNVMPYTHDVMPYIDDVMAYIASLNEKDIQKLPKNVTVKPANNLLDSVQTCDKHENT